MNIEQNNKENISGLIMLIKSARKTISIKELAMIIREVMEEDIDIFVKELVGIETIKKEVSDGNMVLSNETYKSKRAKINEIELPR